MAKLNDKGSGKSGVSRLNSPDPEQLLSTINSFLAGCRKAAVLDFGDQPIVLVPGHFQLEVRAGRLTVEAWNETRSLSRRILSIDSRKPAVLDCTVQRFGGATGALTFLDFERPQAAPRAIKGARQSFAEQFRRMIHRQFPGWEIASLTSAMDLRRSFSAAFPRAHLVRGHHHFAALACPTLEHEPEFLSSALLWFHHLRSQLERAHSLTLALFLSENAGNLTAHRLHWLTGRELGTSLFRFNQHGMAGAVDPADLGNLDTRLSAQYVPPQLTPELKQLLSRLNAIRGVGCTSEINGAISIRFRGLEFARVDRETIRLGIQANEVVSPSETARIEDFAAHLAALTLAQPASHALPIFGERWLESAVRLQPQILDPELQSGPIHGQVLTFAGGERNLIDLLAISASGRLTVVELKTSEDIQLPMQGLDYWMRIRWHLQRNELGPLFPGSSIDERPPKLLLVAPALFFHPSNEIVLRYFSPDIEVERIGVHSDWESALQVAFRLRGADLPISHQRNR